MYICIFNIPFLVSGHPSVPISKQKAQKRVKDESVFSKAVMG